MFRPVNRVCRTRAQACATAPLFRYTIMGQRKPLATMSVRTVFMGSDPIALPLLDCLQAQDDLQLHAVFTQPDRPRGRGMKLQPNAIKAWAQSAGVQVLQPERCAKADAAWCQREGVQLILVMAYGQILRKSMLSVPALGILNFHASLLPAYRGASPIESAIANGELETGVSLMQIVPQLDAGPVLDVERVPIAPDANAAQLRADLATACVPLWRRCWPAIRNGNARFVPQDDAAVTYCSVLSKEDAWLDFARPAVDLANRVRAFHVWPGSCFRVKDVVYKVGAAHADPAQHSCKPGTLLCGKDILRIACAQGFLHILQLQKPGGKMLPIADFLRGHTFLPATVAETVSATRSAD